MKIFGIHILTSKQVKAIKTGVDEAGNFLSLESDRVVAALKQTSLGTVVANVISAVDNDDLSGSQKFEKVLSAVGPEVLNYIQRGGVPALIDDVEDIARQLVQSVYNDFKSTGFGKIVKQLLKLLGL